MIWHLKFNGAQADASELAETLVAFVPNHPEFVIVPIPKPSSRIRQRGYDQANLIARELARKTGTTYCPVPRRSSQTNQRGSNRDQRTSPLDNAYRVAHAAQIKGKLILLIDDVLTTCSTLELAAKAMKAVGAKRVTSLVFARA